MSHQTKIFYTFILDIVYCTASMYTVLPVHFQSYEMVDRRSLNNVNNDLPSYYLSQLVHTVLVNLVSTKGQKFKID